MLSDLLWALRWLRRNPFFTAATVFVLALGIGANTAVFSIVDAVLLRPSPFPSAERLVRIEESGASGISSGIPVNDYQRLAGRTDVLEKTAAYLRDTVTLTGGGEPEQVIAVRALGLFPVLRTSAQLGRTLIASDDEAGSQNVTVLSDRIWRRRWHSDPGVIGRAITISDESYIVVGVMPPDFEFRYPEAELWMPLRMGTGSPWVQLAGRLRAGVSLAQARSALEITAHQIEQEAPKDRAGLRVEITQWRDTPYEKYKLTLIFVLVAVGLMMLIVCADVSALLLSRAVQRQREISIRASLGAGLRQIVRQLLSETLLLAVFGTMAGVVIAWRLLALLTRQLAALPIALPHLRQAGLNGRVMLFNVVLCLLLAILCGLAPALLAVRTDLQGILRSGPGNGAPRSSARLFSVLIAAQAGFAFLLLAGSGLMIHSLVQLQQQDHGFHPDHVLTLRVPVGTLTQPRPTGKYNTRTRQIAYYRQILERVKAVPGIKAAAIVNNPPLSDISSSLDFGLAGPDGKPQPTSARCISPEYFAAMGIPLIAGRTFAETDRTGSPEVAIVNEYLARQLFPNRSALGEKLKSRPAPSGPTIVGIVKDSSQRSYELPPTGEVYIPYQQYIFATFMSTVVVRTEGDPAAFAPALMKQVWAVDVNQPVVKVETMEDVIANSIWRPRFSAWIFGVLSGLSVILAAMGMYGVIAYTSALRAPEIGIRVALGASTNNVLGVILRGAMIPLACGIGLSAAAALPLSRLLTDLLYGIRGSDPVSYLSAGILLLTVGAAASAYPAWRAAHRDPLQTLRSE